MPISTPFASFFATTLHTFAEFGSIATSNAPTKQEPPVSGFTTIKWGEVNTMEHSGGHRDSFGLHF